MGRLPLTDAAWLLIESRERPMHVGGLRLFTRPPDAPDDWLQSIAAQAMAHSEPRPPFNFTLKEPYGRLGTFAFEPADRLALVRASMDATKARMAGMTRAELTDYAIAITSPLVLGNLTGLSGRGHRRPLFNVTISNVPGPTETLYWNGAEMQGLYPASLLQDGHVLNITQTSYRDQMAFGITADRAALPRIQRLIDHLEDELALLEGIG